MVSPALYSLPVILASQSPRRIRLLEEAGFSVEVIPSLADELDPEFHEIAEIVEENARIKGLEVVRRLRQEGRIFPEETLLVAADTLVVMGTKVYGKPKDLQEAEAFQLELGGVPHQVYTGVYLAALKSGKTVSFHVRTDVVLRKRSVAEIHDTFTRVNPLDKAGAYGYQDAQEIVESLSGSESNVIGLPMEALIANMTQLLNSGGTA